MTRQWICTLAVLSVLTACGGGGSGGGGLPAGLGESEPPALLAASSEDEAADSLAASIDKSSPAAVTWKPLKPGTSWQWQIDGKTINETILDKVSNPRKMYDVDMESTSVDTIKRLKAKGIYVVCYMETGGWEKGRSDSDKFPESVKGNPVEEFETERWLDIRQRDVLFPIMKARLDVAKSKGCDGIEPDLDDAYTRKQSELGFPLTKADQSKYNRALIQFAHDRGMSMGLKNGPEFAEEMVIDNADGPGADWALNEECNYNQECEGYAAFITAGKAVFNVEYTVPNKTKIEDFCPQDNLANFDGLLKKSSATLGALPRTACRFE